MSWPWGPSIAEKKSDTFDPWYPDHFDRRTNIAVDWKETPEAHIFTADIPGLTKEEVKIEVDEGVRALKISGELPKHESVDEKSKFHRFERLHGSFWRRFPLPKNARLDGEVKAKMEKGVLTLTIPKRPGPETGRRSIQICG